MKKIIALALATVMSFSLAACAAPAPAPSPTPEAPAVDAPVTDAPAVDAPAGDAQKYKVGVSLLTLEHVFFNVIKDGIQAKADELGVEVIMMDAKQDANTQLSQIQDFITQDCDAIIMAPTNSGGSKSMVELAAAKNIPVFTMDVASDGDTVSHVATDNYKGGEVAAQWALDNVLTEKKGTVAVITYSEIESCVQREKGFTEYLAANAPQIVVADVQNYSGDQAKAANAMQDMLVSNPDIDVVFCVGDPAAMGALSSIKAASADTKIIGFDGNPEGVAEIKKGENWVADVAQDPTTIGATVLETAIKHLKGEAVEKLIPITPYMIDATNAA